MARWKLMQPHYLNVPGTEWEYAETTHSGESGRSRFTVPRLLDPSDPKSCNYPGMCIVSNEPGGKDFVFVGPPSPEMEPLDDEAQAISDAERGNWKHPIETLPGDFSQSLLTKLQQQIDQLSSGNNQAPVVVKGVDPAEFAKVQEQLAQLMARNAELESKQTARRA